MKKNLLIVLPSFIMCVILAVCVCVAVFWNFGDDTDNLIHPHGLTLVEEKQATCTENGNTAYYFCGECEKLFSDADGKIEITDRASVIIEATHNFVNGECRECGAEHDCDFASTVTPPTCTEAGFTTYECGCGRSYIGNYTEPVGHDYFNRKCRICGSEHDCKYTETVEEATCAERGFTTYKCDCGYSYKDNFTDALGHDYVDEVCTRCGKLYGVLEYKSYGSYYFCSGIDSAFNIDEITQLSIPSTYNGLPVRGIGNNAFEKCKNLTEVTIGDGITSIGSFAFLQCSLTSVTIPASVVNIYGHAFSYSKLSDIYFEGTVDEWKAIIKSENWNYATGEYTVHCTDGDYSDKYTAGLDYTLSDDGTYYICSGIGTATDTDVIIPSTYNNLPVTVIGDIAFTGLVNRNGLTSIIIPDSVTSIGESAFYYCYGLTSITIPVGVTSIGRYAFYACNSLTIYCETASKPDSWDSEWNRCESYGSDWSLESYANYCPVVWDYKNNDVADDGNIYTVIDGIRYAIKDDSASVVRQSRAISGDKTIPQTITYKNIKINVTAIVDSAFSNCSKLTGIIIPDGMTSIGNRAFSSCNGLTSVTIPDSVTTIGERVFYNCYGLTSVTIPGSVTSIGEWAFSYCYGLTSVTIPDSVTSIGEWAFHNCNGVTSITIPVGVTSIGRYAFYACTSLTVYCETVSKPDGWDSEWNRCESYGSDWSLESYANYCPVVWDYKNNDVADDGNIYTIIDGIRYAIKDDSASVVRQSRAISGDKTISQTITYKNIKINVTAIADSAFLSCDGLTGIIIPDGVTSIGKKAFSYCNGLTSVTISDSVVTIRANAFYNCIGLTSVTIPNSVVTIGESAFSSCNGLTSVTISDSVDTIGDNAFSYCSHLETLILGNGVTYLGRGAFRSCSELKSVQIPPKVTSINNSVFSYCGSLTSVTIHKNVSKIGEYAFSYCSSLTDIVFEGTYEQWRKIEKNKGWNTNIESINIRFANGVLYNYAAGLNFTYCYSEDGGYYICSGLSEPTDYGFCDIIIPSSYDGIPVLEIGERAFKDCKYIESITIPDSITTIGDYAFGNCSGLTKIIVPDSVTSIGNYAFYGCSNLTEITIPAGVTALESYTFTNCPKLKEIIFKGTLAEWRAIPHTGWLYISECTVKCTDGRLTTGR